MFNLGIGYFLKNKWSSNLLFQVSLKLYMGFTCKLYNEKYYQIFLKAEIEMIFCCLEGSYFWKQTVKFRMW